MKKVSVYLKSGKRNAASFYRFFQYFDNIEGVCVHYHKRLPDDLYRKVMPISGHSIPFKITLALYMYIRVLASLINDILWAPDFVVISKTLTTKCISPLCKLLLYYLKRRGVRIILDFDDQILSTGEISRKDFDFLSKLSYRIFSASPILTGLVCEKWKNKVVLVPTTDSQTYLAYKDDIKENRLKHYDSVISVVWVASSSSIIYLQNIMTAFEDAGEKISRLKKKLQLTVVCDKELVYTSRNFDINNIVWERDIALKCMLEAHIGIMPLENTESTRGKGGFKLIQYIGCALPVIGSDVGINKNIVNLGNGVLVHDLDNKEWTDAIIKLSTNKSIWEECSSGALKSYEEYYSYKNNEKIWKDILFEE